MELEIAPAVLAAACLWAIVDKGIHTGVVITVGLVLIIAACLALFDSGWVYRAAYFLIYGCLLIAGDLLWKRYVSPRLARRHLQQEQNNGARHLEHDRFG